VRDHGFLDGFAEVLPEVEAIRDLDRVRCVCSCALGVGPCPIPTDHLDTWVRGQPGGEGLRGAVGQHIDRPVGVHVQQHGGIHRSTQQREIVNAQHPRS
jgi:hypothetical protein